MINLKQELVNYPPIDMDALIQKGTDIPDGIKNSMILYNKALESIRRNSEDIAVIELKKAVSMYPGFHEAMNLLGVCYSYMKEYAKAAEVFRKVIAEENNSVKALRYMELLNAPESPASMPKDKKKSTAMGKKVQKKDTKKELFFQKFFKLNYKFDVYQYLTGFASGVLVLVIILIIATSFGNKNVPDSNGDTVKQSATAGEENSQKEDSSKQSGNQEQNEDYQNLLKEIDAANAEVDYYKNVVMLYEIEKLVSTKDYEAAADKLVLMKTVDFKEGEKEKFDNYLKTVIPKAATAVYNQGLNLLNSKKYQEAIEKFDRIKIYGNDWSYMDSVLYYSGKCYIGLNNSENAIDEFQKVIDNYPGSKFAEWSKNRITQLTIEP